MALAVHLAVISEILEEAHDTYDLLPVLTNWRQNVLSSVSVIAYASTMRNRKTRIDNYVEYVMPMYSIDDFKDRFRMSKTSFDQLVAELSPVLYNRCKMMKIGPEKQLLIYVKYVSSLHTLQAIAELFGVCETTVHVIVKYVAKMICKHILPSVIKWPNSEHSIAEIENGFINLKGFPGVIGAIDGSHIPIRTPKQYAENYINRKCFPSIILQAVCDSNLNFIDVYCGWPGSVHDSRVLKNSPLYMETETDQNTRFPGNIHLIGDSAYGLSSWLMVPVKDYGNLNEKKKRFNYIHSSTRMCIERAFGALKGRFRRLKYVDMLEIEKIVNITLSCCALHQLCLSNLEDIKECLQEGLDINEEINNYQDFMPRCESAEYKRNLILALLDN